MMGGGGSREKEGFRAPRVHIDRVYTRKGDGGSTRLVGGTEVVKDDLRVEAYGSVDELNATVGCACASLRLAAVSCAPLTELVEVLTGVQHELFNLGSLLATPAEREGAEMPRVTEHAVRALEQEIDRRTADLPPLTSFVLPGGGSSVTDLQLARTVCRRAERRCVRLATERGLDAAALAYLNRLSDALFVWSRWAGRQFGEPEHLWDPNAGSSRLP